jgi:hypothetical protein
LIIQIDSLHIVNDLVQAAALGVDANSAWSFGLRSKIPLSRGRRIDG